MPMKPAKSHLGWRASRSQSGWHRIGVNYNMGETLHARWYFEFVARKSLDSATFGFCS